MSGFGIYFGYSLLGYILWFGYFDGCHDILGWKISLLLDCLIASIELVDCFFLFSFFLFSFLSFLGYFVYIDDYFFNL